MEPAPPPCTCALRCDGAGVLMCADCSVGLGIVLDDCTCGALDCLDDSPCPGCTRCIPRPPPDGLDDEGGWTPPPWDGPPPEGGTP